MSSRLRRVIEFGIAFGMKPVKAKTKEDRLAEALRANLRRRKASAPVPVDTNNSAEQPSD